MALVVLVGAQWGDEGKGKVVDAYGAAAQLLVHYAGGANPGQTLAIEGERHVFHLVPAAPLRDGKECLLGQGMAIDPRLLLHELDVLHARGVLRGALWVDERAHVVLPHHLLLDLLRDESMGASGTPRRGVGPCYADKHARRGIQIGDLASPGRLRKKLDVSFAAAEPALRALGGELPELEPVIEDYLACGERLAARVVDGGRHVGGVLFDGGHVLLEGQLGAMVDIDHGAYPFVVTASTVAGGACTGAGIPPTLIDEVVGVAKAYTTRAGAGPFVPEVTGDLADHLIRGGNEIVAATAQPRRVGMFDVPALRYAARVNGFERFALTKLDVLGGLPEIPVCLGYELDGEVHDEPPYQGMSRARPKTILMPGWPQDIRDCRTWDELPRDAKSYVRTLADAAGLEPCLIGVGSAPAQTIVLSNPFD